LSPPLRDVLAESGLSTQAFYRCFRSKGELLLVILDAGRDRLTAYLVHRMGRTNDPARKVAALVRGVMAQAADPSAAGRTRPFAVGEDRIAEQFPVEHLASVERLAGLLVDPIMAMRGQADNARERAIVERDVMAVYDLTFAALRRLLINHSAPTPAEVDHLVDFTLGGIGDNARPGAAITSKRTGKGR
ncbi:MAG: TetR/AcrR family transcriptional regulator, partial [Nitrososphaerales archaeon]